LEGKEVAKAFLWRELPLRWPTKLVSCDKQKSSQASDVTGQEIKESMKRITLLLMVAATVLLAASGIAWAVTKTCPPDPKNCWGTSGADVLKSTSKNNNMLGKGGNDTYTRFGRSNSGYDVILDSGGRDKLTLFRYSQSEVKPRSFNVDVNNNGKPDALVLVLVPDRPSNRNRVAIGDFWDDTRSKPPYRRGPGYIESILFVEDLPAG